MKNFCERLRLSINDVQRAIDYYLDDLEDQPDCKTLAEYFDAFKTGETDLITLLDNAYQQARDVLSLDELDKDRREPKNNHQGGKGFLQVEKIKELLDALMMIVQFVKPLYLVKSGKSIEVGDKSVDFYDAFDGLYKNVSAVIGIYNKTRNHVTKKPYLIDKFKINFDNSMLLDGWDVNKEIADSGVLLRKDGRYYLGIMRKDATNIFNYIPEPDDSEDKKKYKETLRQRIIADGEDNFYEKMIYKLLPDPSKMLPKVFFAKSNIDYYQPSQEILDIREKGLHKREANNLKAVRQWIDFMKQSLKKHPEWGSYFSFEFSPTSEYADVSQFYKEVADQGYNLSFDNIKTNYINEKLKTGELYLFEIYNKDFSSDSKGKPNLHSSYWKLLFNPENLHDLVLKLNGRAEIFFRPASLKKSETAVHEAGKAIDSKNPLNPKRQSRFDYEIIKDRRFTADKFFFHCPITFNFKSPSVSRFNDSVIDYLQKHPVHIIGIDRGERHLLYYSVINADGQIIQQGSFNTVNNSYETDNGRVDMKTDYHRLLGEKENQRDAARKSWSAIENIKELKSGYLSHIVHKLASLMIEHNAVVVLEDLNFGFKRGRFKVEKQVYQKFEKSLIDKLNYLVFKDRKTGQAGHYLSAYQLTAPFESFQKLGKQSGFLFYVPSYYTSKIDPMTGFANLLDTTYKSMEKTQDFIRKFDQIRFNPAKDYFEFSFNYARFTPDKSGTRKDWTVCTAGRERYRYDKQKKEYIGYDVTAELKRLFTENNIDYQNGDDLVKALSGNTRADFHKSLLFYLGLTLQLRHIYKSGEVEKDYILSPVADKDGNFFDSRTYEDENGQPLKDARLPANADANGAYNIARKGLLVLRQIREDGRPGAISNAEWFDFAQNIG